MRPDAIVLRFVLPQGWDQGSQGQVAVVALPELLPAGAVEPLDTAIDSSKEN